MRVTGRLCGACAALLLLAPSPAEANKVFHGRSGQGRPVTLTVGDTGLVQRFRIDWRARCRERGSYLTDGIVVRPFRRHTTADVFRVDTGYRFRIHGFRVSAHVFIRGTRQAAPSEQWTGTLRVSDVVRRRGKVVDRCHLARTVWSATPPPGPGSPGVPAPTPAPAPPEANPNPTAGTWKLTMTSDPGDYIGAGQTWSDGPPESIKVNAFRNRFEFSIDRSDGGFWSGDFVAPDGQDLAATTYTDAQRFGGPGHAGLDINGMGRGCNMVSGRFTVREVIFDASGTLRSFKADFEQHCEGAAPALRGTMEFQSS